MPSLQMKIHRWFKRSYPANSPQVRAAMDRVIARARSQGQASEDVGDISISGSLHAHNNQVYLLVWRIPVDYPDTEQERIIQSYF